MYPHAKIDVVCVDAGNTGSSPFGVENIPFFWPHATRQFIVKVCCNAFGIGKIDTLGTNISSGYKWHSFISILGTVMRSILDGPSQLTQAYPAPPLRQLRQPLG